MRTQALLLVTLCLLLCCNRLASFKGDHLDSDNSGDSTGAVAVGGVATQKTETKRVDEEERVIDILLVLDNSSSMDEAHQVLSSKLAPLISAVAGFDWQIGIITTDVNDCYRSIVKKGVNEQDFTKEVGRLTEIKPSTSGESNKERAIASATKALNMELQRMRGDGEPSCDGGKVTDWPRADTTLAVLIVTDEDVENRSEGRQCDLQCMQNFYDLVTTRVPAGYIYGILNTTLGFLRELQHGGSMFTMHHPIYTSLSSYVVTNFDKILTAISENVAGKTQNVFMLEKYHNGEDSHLILKRDDGSTFTLATANYSIKGRVLTIDPNKMPGVDSLTITYSWGKAP